MRRILVRSALVVAGIAAISAVFWRVGWPAIEANLEAIGPWFLVLLLVQGLTQTSFVIGLREVLEPRPTTSMLPRIFAIYLMGDSINYVAPPGGEALKAHLLSEVTDGEGGLTAITLDKHADLAAQCLVAFVGVGIALACFRLPRALAVAAILGTGVLIGLLLVMTWALGRGAYSPILKRLAGWKVLAARLHRLQSGALAVDERIRRFHAERQRRFFLAVLCAALGWGGGVVETWIVLRLLAPGSGFAEAVAAECLSMVLNNLLLFIPGKAGGAEGVRTGVLVALGLPAAVGAAWALARRSRELVWMIPGWILLLRERLRRPRTAGLPAAGA